MDYISTRGMSGIVTASEAIKQGLAPDGGLFLPQEIVPVTKEQLAKWQGLSYAETAAEVISAYLTDYSYAEIKSAVEGAYGGGKFDHQDVAPVKSLNEHLHILELWHGPTCAFKDMALQLLPRLLTMAAQKTGEKNEIVILVATSGDTGKAALEGFKDVAGTKIIVFYPANGVSAVQKQQMVTQEGENVFVVAVDGNFDDCQSGVKKVFADEEFNQKILAKGKKFSSANSINWGRLVPQIVYYFRAYLDLVNEEKLTMGDKINFVVPSGNFGNILAGYFAREMGLPINRLICAANANNVLADFIATGVYDRNRDLLKTISPSMDILISSNLERLLYLLTGRDQAKIVDWMKQLQLAGKYAIDEKTKKTLQEVFWADYTTDDDTLSFIQAVWQEEHYLMDTHTAVAYKVYRQYQQKTGDTTQTVIASTASPFKFNTSVAKAILTKEEMAGKSDFELLDVLSQCTGWAVPKGLKDLDKKPARYQETTSSNGVGEAVAKILLVD